ncbi:MAG: hypothetical protein M1834_002571 [Cirrosporium novae-zelandiae]|nr:MAG: hypothetical protein M1834_002571 [Cirrosporium novae-zelandiae]
MSLFPGSGGNTAPQATNSRPFSFGNSPRPPSSTPQTTSNNFSFTSHSSNGFLASSVPAGPPRPESDATSEASKGSIFSPPIFKSTLGPPTATPVQVSGSGNKTKPSIDHTKEDASAARVDDFLSPIITLVVGEEQKKMTAHQSLLYRKSGFFAAALSGNFRESKEDLIKLPEDDPELIKLLLHWMYTGKILPIDKRTWKIMFDLMVLTDKYDISEFAQDLIWPILNLFSTIRLSMKEKDIAHTYYALPPTCGFRTTLVAFFIATFQHQGIYKSMLKIVTDKDFFGEATLILLKWKSGNAVLKEILDKGESSAQDLLKRDMWYSQQDEILGVKFI